MLPIHAIDTRDVSLTSLVSSCLFLAQLRGLGLRLRGLEKRPELLVRHGVRCYADEEMQQE